MRPGRSRLWEEYEELRGPDLPMLAAPGIGTPEAFTRIFSVPRRIFRRSSCRRPKRPKWLRPERYSAASSDEALFSLIFLGDDRHIARTYVLGELPASGS